MIPLLLITALSTFSCANPGTWATLPMSVMPYLSDENHTPSTVPTLFGTPPQQINVTVDLTSGTLAAFSHECILCAGRTLLDTALSSTFKTTNAPWSGSVPSFSGVEAFDTVGFGGLLSAQDQLFINMLDGSNRTLAKSLWNGQLGLLVNPLSTATISNHILTRLHESSSLLNPVVGMRFDPAKPKITIGALDPNDYEGTINWVEINHSPDPNSEYLNMFKFDGVKGYDGQFVPYSASLTAALDTFFLSIALPNVDLYFGNTNSTGPVPRPIGFINETGLVEYNCTSNYSTLASASRPPRSPYVALTATINGVDYLIDSTDNLLRPQSLESLGGYCPVGLENRSDTAQPSVVLGLPFLRSVYVAYRFTTNDCPGYYGFAFPSGSNRTRAQIAQTPKATPRNSAQCLALAAPTSTPTAIDVLAQEVLAKNTYAVYGRQGDQVPLVGVGDMPKMVWNWTALLG